jgi:hypothetical protein
MFLLARLTENSWFFILPSNFVRPAVVFSHEAALEVATTFGTLLSIRGKVTQLLCRHVLTVAWCVPPWLMMSWSWRLLARKAVSCKYVPK